MITTFDFMNDKLGSLVRISIVLLSSSWGGGDDGDE
jgi:hypothetical protein